MAFIGGLFACGDETSVPRGGNERPTAVLSIPATAIVGDAVFMDASESSDTDGWIVEYRFTPGDEAGTVITPDDYLLWSYTSADTFTVTLTVVDNRGGKDSVASSISVVP